MLKVIDILPGDLLIGEGYTLFIVSISSREPRLESPWDHLVSAIRNGNFDFNHLFDGHEIYWNRSGWLIRDGKIIRTIKGEDVW